MADTVYKYRVWCATEGKYVHVWAEEEPTTCPENNAHAIDPARTAVVDEVSEVFPQSDLGAKVAVHSSPKPIVPGKTTYAAWVGAGDNLQGDKLGGGDLLEFDMETGNSMCVKEVHFHPKNGRIWIHEGYLKFEGGGKGDFLEADVVAPPTPLHTNSQLGSLDLIIENNWVKYSPGGPGTGTHGFAGNPYLIPRSFSGDGDWDYDGVNLTPNFAGNGGFKMSNIERTVHKYINKIPCRGTLYEFVCMSSNETAELPAGYFLRIKVHNKSNSNWFATVFMEIYRERTNIP